MYRFGPPRMPHHAPKPPPAHLPPPQGPQLRRRHHRRPEPLPRALRLAREPREVRPPDRRVAAPRQRTCSRRPAPGAIDSTLSVNELILAYFRHAQAYYVKDGRPTSEQDNIRQALRFVRQLYGTTPGRGVRPAGPEGRPPGDDRGRPVAQADQQGRQPDPGDVPLGRRARSSTRARPRQALAAVAGLEKGRSDARERPPVRPVAEETVEATLPHLSPQVAAMVRLQLLTAARPGEVCVDPAPRRRPLAGGVDLPARVAQDGAPRPRAGDRDRAEGAGGPGAVAGAGPGRPLLLPGRGRRRARDAEPGPRRPAAARGEVHPAQLPRGGRTGPATARSPTRPSSRSGASP